MSEMLEKLAAVLIVGKEGEVITLTQKALDNSISAKEILDRSLLAGMDVVGIRFKVDDMFIPEVLLCARCIHGAMEILKPHLSETDAAGADKVIIGTVEGDLHDIGKNLVAMMMQAAGFKVIDMGTNITPQQFVGAVKEHKPNILDMSALLTTTMPKMEETIQALKEAGIRNQVKVMAGGASVTQGFVSKIGGYAYGANAASASEKAKALVTG